ncbi:MAG: hypothetical protein WBA89_25820 [Microcoleus sp.]
MELIDAISNLTLFSSTIANVRKGDRPFCGKPNIAVSEAGIY